MFSAIRTAMAAALAVVPLAGAAASEWPPGAPDLSLAILPTAAACLEADDCRFLVRIENLGSAIYEGPAALMLSAAAPAVPGFGETAPWTCTKLTFTRSSCSAKDLRLAPGEVADVRLPLRFLPTPMSAAETCVSLDWQEPAVRDLLYRDVAATLGHPAAGAPPSGIMAALFGTWGEGDLIAANDRACTRIAVGVPPPAVSCPEGEEPVNGACTALARLCTGGRSFDTAAQRCSCPAERPAFDAVTRSCAVASQNTRPACPRSEPLWNAAAARCEAWDVPAAVAEPVPEAAPVKRTGASAEPERTVAVAPRRARTASSASGKGRRADTHVGPRRRPVAMAKAAPERGIVYPRRFFALRHCPPLFKYNSRRNYCLPWLVPDRDILVNGRIRRRG